MITKNIVVVSNQSKQLNTYKRLVAKKIEEQNMSARNQPELNRLRVERELYQAKLVAYNRRPF